MKKLVTRFVVLVGCALPLGLATGVGTAGADGVGVTGEVSVTVGDRTVVVPIPECAVGPGCLVQGQPNICVGLGDGMSFGMHACTALGEH